MPKKEIVAQKSTESYLIVAGAILLGILVLYSVAASTSPVQSSGIEFTSILHEQLSGGQTEFTFSILNSNDKPFFCQAVLNISENGIVLKSLKKDAGLLEPNQEKAMSIKATVPKDSTYELGAICSKS